MTNNLNKRIPVEYVDLVKVRDLIDRRGLKYYKVGIILDLNYRSFLVRLNGKVRFKLKELIKLSEYLNIDLSEIVNCDMYIFLKDSQ